MTDAEIIQFLTLEKVKMEKARKESERRLIIPGLRPTLAAVQRSLTALQPI